MKNTFDEQLAKDGRYADVTEELYQSFERRLAAEGKYNALLAEQQVRLAVVLKLQEVNAPMESVEQVANAVNLLTRIVLTGR